MIIKLVEKFCTVPFIPLTDYDAKAISNAERFEILFEEQMLQCYAWGNGKTILLVHGWGSRASHVAPLARILTSAGFKVIAFDAPAHSSINENRQKDKSSMFEFCRAVSSVVEKINPVYVIIGHSLGAASSAFDAAGYLRLSDCKVNVEKLVLISCPANLKSVIKSFSKNNGLNCDEELRLIKELENDFNFRVDDYSVVKAIQNIDSEILVIHDNDDPEIPFSDAEDISKAAKKAQTCFTNGSGHNKILINRNMLAKVKEFLIGYK